MDFCTFTAFSELNENKKEVNILGSEVNGLGSGSFLQSKKYEAGKKKAKSSKYFIHSKASFGFYAVFVFLFSG